MARDKDCFNKIQNALQAFNIPSVITKTQSDGDLSPGYKVLKALASIFCGYNVKGSYDMLNELTGERYTNSELKSFIKGGKPFTDDEDGCKIKVSDIIGLAEFFDIRLHYAASFEEVVNNYCRAYAMLVEKDPTEDRNVQDACLGMFSDYVSMNDWPYPQITKKILDSIFSKFERQYLTSNSVYSGRNDDSNTVVISTIHSSKGLEYDTVFVVCMDHDVFPKTGKINEEYDRYIEGIEDLKKSIKSLDRLRYNID